MPSLIASSFSPFFIRGKPGDEAMYTVQLATAIRTSAIKPRYMYVVVCLLDGNAGITCTGTLCTHVYRQLNE